jgi:phenylacetate-CoA ligase
MSGRTEALYLASPVWLQQTMVAGYGWWWRHRRFGREFKALAADLKQRERSGAPAFHEYQTHRLKRLLRAARRSPYYGPLLADLDPTGSPWDTLKRLPVLSKEQLRTHGKRLLTAPPSRDTIVFRSSGTTGTPTDIYYTRAFHALETAIIEARNLNWGKATYRDRRVMFGARKVCRFDQVRPPFWRYSPAENLAYASVYHLAPPYLPHYVRFLHRFAPTVVMGYPSALYAVADYASSSGERLPAARGVFTSAERLHPYMRTAIERAWQCQVFDRYGAVEGCVSASQCEHGRYHVNPEVGVLELVDVHGAPVAPGEEGEIVCTGLANTLQPLIRYRIGDYARWAVDQDCACGRATPVLEGIDGRVEDCCYTADGRRIVRFDTVFKGVANIRQAQIVQERLRRFVVAVVADAAFGPRDAEMLQANMRLHVGDADVQVRRVDAIPRTPAGKFMAVVCRLPPSEKRLWGAAREWA